MDQPPAFEQRYFEYLYTPRYAKYHVYLTPEPWSRRRVVATWLVVALFVVAGPVTSIRSPTSHATGAVSGGGRSGLRRP